MSHIGESSSSLHSLVTQALVDTQKYYCPFLERGFCREQSRCNFSHDCQISTRIPTDYCHFYLANQCLYGQDCKFLHTEPELDPPYNEFPLDPTAIATGSAFIIETGRPSSLNNDYDDDEEDEEEDDEEDEDDDYVEANGNVDDNHGETVQGKSAGQEATPGVNEVLQRLAQHTTDESEGFMYNSNTNTHTHTNNNDYADATEAAPNQAPRWHDASAETSQQHDSTPQHTTASSSLSSPRLKARVSQRCAMMAPASSSSASSSSTSTSVSANLATASLFAKLHHPSPHSLNSLASTTSTAQISNKNATTTHPESITNTTTAASSSSSSSSSKPHTAAKGAWQNTRLIASIRNNLVESSTSGSGSSSTGNNTSNSTTTTTTTEADLPLCPYSLNSGECPFPEGRCNYLHGLVCDLCYSACLHPFNEKQRHQHREECLREHEREMELSFAVQRSKDKVCGICMDTVVEKKPITSSRFGILEKCNHIFCLDCIRKWRGTKQFDSRTIRACPECRVSSDFVVPSKYWVEDQDDKDKLITDYKNALRAKPCRYFKEGKGECPFAGSCFYRHAYPDGSVAVMDAPKPRRRLYGARGPTTSVANYILWNILTSTDEDDLSINDDLGSLYDMDEMYDIGHSDGEEDFVGWQ